jgi:gliding motility-associated-like protein
VGDPDISLSALRSPAGADIDEVVWSVDYDDDGLIDDTNLPGIGLFGAEFIVSSPNTGRYFAEISTASGTPPIVSDVGGIFIEFFGPPEFAGVDILDTNLSIDPDINNIEILINGNSEYEYALNGGEFQDEAVFNDIPPGLNTILINDKNGCGTTEEEFLMVAYPKFFTPNGDGVNETWNIRGIERLGSPVVYIFDRYGKLLKQLDANTAWDGTFNGSLMPSSDYWFRFEYNDAVDELVVAKTRKTHFTLKR